MTTTVAYAGTTDGQIHSTDNNADSYATARAGTGALTADTAGTSARIGQYYDDYEPLYSVWESFVQFDTSAVGTDTVSAAVLNVTSSTDSSSTDFTIEARLHDWGTGLTTADYVAGASLSGKTLLAHHATSSGFTANTAYDFTDDAMPANVNGSGATRMLLCSSRTTAGTAPSAYVHEDVFFKTADTTGTTSDPKLTVTHAAGGGSAQDLTLGFQDASPAVYAPTLTQTTPTQSLGALALLDGANALYALELDPEGNHEVYPPVLTTSNTLVLGLLDGGAALYAPTLLPQPVTVELAHLDAGAALYAPTLATTAPTVELGLLDAGAQLYAPTLLPQPVTVGALALLDGGSALFDFTAATGPITAVLTLVDGGAAVYAPTVATFSVTQSITLAQVATTPAVYAPTLAATAPTIQLPQLDASPAVYAPTAAPAAVTATLTLVATTPTVYAPTVAPAAWTVQLAQLDGGAAVYSLIAQGGVLASGGVPPTGMASTPRPSGSASSAVPVGSATSPMPR